MRTLLIAVMLLCGALAAWSIYVQPFRDQARAMDSVNRLGGSMQLREANRPSWQKWLVSQLVGESYYVDVVAVELSESNADDGTLQAISRMSELRELSLDRTAISDKGLAFINGLQSLEHLSLRYTPITDHGIAHLVGLKRLVSLHLTGTKITDACLVRLAELQALKDLYVRWTEVSGEGVATLRAILPRCHVHAHLLTK